MTGLWLALIGGLALFSFGLNETAEGIRRIASGWLRDLLLRVTRTPWGSLGLGILATVLAGSSSAITVMTIGFAGVGALRLRQALEVMLGAAIGTTLTVQLVSFNVIRFAPILIFLGVAIIFWERSQKREVGWARLVMGFGLIFYGMMVMVDTVQPMAKLPAVVHLTTLLARHPVWGFILAVAMTAIIQSSTTVIALVISFSIHGLISPSLGLVLVLGANLGSPAAAIYSAILDGAPVQRRAAFGYLGTKALGILLFFLLAPLVRDVLFTIDPAPGRWLANAHTLFNVFVAALFVPLSGPLARLLERLIPEPPAPDLRDTGLDPDLVGMPGKALDAAATEVARLARIVHEDMLEPLVRFIAQPQGDAARKIQDAEAQTDLLHHAITRYLFRIAESPTPLPEALRFRQIRLLYVANHLEHLADSLIKLLATREKLRDRAFPWEDAVAGQFDTLVGAVVSHFQRMVDAIERDDADEARLLVQEHPDLLRQETDVRVWIMTELATRETTPSVSTLLEISDDLSVISQRMATVGRALLGIY